jgi:hypothetical protein
MYARQAQNTEAERQAGEIRLRAERKCGQLTEEMVTAQGQRSDLTSYHDDTKSAALTNAGISKVQASKWERLAAIPEAEFEADLADPMWRPTTSGLLQRHEACARDPGAAFGQVYLAEHAICIGCELTARNDPTPEARASDEIAPTTSRSGVRPVR